jgi:alpha-L-rhamnosidase
LRLSRITLTGFLTALLTAAPILVTPAGASTDREWISYLEQPAVSTVRPVAVTVMSGHVSGAVGLTAQAGGATTLTMQAGGPPATLLLDYGVEVEGTPYINVKSYSGGTPAITMAFSESKTYLYTRGVISGDFGVTARTTSVTVDTASVLDGDTMQGFRFETLTLRNPGTVVLKGAGTMYGGFLADAAQYQGYFYSSDAAFTRMYYDGAYTEQADMQPTDVNGAPRLSVLDGTKRDRAIWSGDLEIEGQGIADTLGSNGDGFVRQSLLRLITTSPRGGGLNGTTFGPNAQYSFSYSQWTVDAAVDYYRDTGDDTFARQITPWIEGQLAYDATRTNGTGLIVTTSKISSPGGGFDWDPYDPAKAGVVTAYNVLYDRALQDAAYLETALGHASKAGAYTAAASTVRNAINEHLFNRATGTYYLSESDHATLAQDANSLAIVFGVAPTEDYAGILGALKSLWGPHGSAPYSGTKYDDHISPFVTALEVEADYIANDATDAQALIKLTWSQMIDPAGPFYTGTFWERFTPDDPVVSGWDSLSHGWSSGPTPIMSGYVLGVRPVDPGYSSFTVEPHYGSLASAEGAVPTPYGPIIVNWSRTNHGHTLTVHVPARTKGTVALPDGARRTLDGGAQGTTTTLSP